MIAFLREIISTSKKKLKIKLTNIAPYPRITSMLSSGCIFMLPVNTAFILCAFSTRRNITAITKQQLHIKTSFAKNFMWLVLCFNDLLSISSFQHRYKRKIIKGFFCSTAIFIFCKAQHTLVFSFINRYHHFTAHF